MTKAERLALFKSRYYERNGMRLAALMSVSRAEIKNEARAVKSKVAAQMEDSTASGDEFSLASRLQFDSAGIRAERETDILLSPEEKRQLAKETLSSIVKSEPITAEVVESEQFAENPDAVYTPLYTHAERVEAEAFARFELDCEAFPLSLMP
jgi:hypothetical protein